MTDRQPPRLERADNFKPAPQQMADKLLRVRKEIDRESENVERKKDDARR